MERNDRFHRLKQQVFLLTVAISNLLRNASAFQSPALYRPVILTRRGYSTKPDPESDDLLEEYIGDFPPSLYHPASTEEESSILADLNARRKKLTLNHALPNWRQASHVTRTAVTVDDWVRRVAMDSYPTVVAGGVTGGLYLCDLSGGCIEQEWASEGTILDRVPGAHQPNGGDAGVLKLLYGNFDRGGPVSIVVRGNTVVSSGREGGVKIWSIVGQEKDAVEVGGRKWLIPCPKIQLGGLDGVLVTSMKFDWTGRLWVGGSDGKLRAYDDVDAAMTEKEDDANGNAATAMQVHQPLVATEFVSGAILDVAVSDGSGCGVCSTQSGAFELFDLEDGRAMGSVRPLRPNMHARSAIIVAPNSGARGDEKNDVVEEDCSGSWSVICGGGDGSLHRFRLNLDDTYSRDEHDSENCKLVAIDANEPFVKLDGEEARMRPSHTGPVMCLASPSDGMFVSGAQDGTIRVWDVLNPSTKDSHDRAETDDTPSTPPLPKCRYALYGYKSWLGSICTDGLRLISDGTGYTIVVRDFTPEN